MHMSPALNGSSALQCFERVNMVEIRNRISTRDCHIYVIMYYNCNVCTHDLLIDRGIGFRRCMLYL